MPPAGRPANCEPSAAGRSWKGGARERAYDVFFAVGQKRRRSKVRFAPTWKGRSKSILEIWVMKRTRGRKSPSRPSGRRRLCAVRAFCRRQNLGAGGIHFRRAFESPKGGAALWAAEPKTKGHPFVLEETAKIDIPCNKKKRRAAAAPNRSPAAAGPVWKGGAAT